MLDYTYRDFVQTWYQRLSDDDQFHDDVRTAVQRVIIAFSERFVLHAADYLKCKENPTIEHNLLHILIIIKGII